MFLLKGQPTIRTARRKRRLHRDVCCRFFILSMFRGFVLTLAYNLDSRFRMREGVSLEQGL